MPSLFLRGALIQMTQAFGGSMPNVILFQYNPETLRHGWTPAAPDGEDVGGNPLAVRGLPAETFSFTLVMDAEDRIIGVNPLALESGIYTRLAALEMLVFPTVGNEQAASLTAVVSTAVNAAPGDFSSSLQTVPAGDLPVVFFVWGSYRIVPVIVQNLDITETLYDAALNPTHAEASITLRVLTRQDLANASGALAALARSAYDYTHGERQTFAAENLANAAEGMIGLIPFL